MTNRIILPLGITLIAFFARCKNNKQIKSEEIASSNNVFAAVDYDKVVAYHYDGEGDIEIIGDKGKLAPKIIKQTDLGKDQTIRLTNILCDQSTYGGAVAACFDPHFGLVFYKKSKPVEYVSVCLNCNYLVSSIKIPGQDGFSEQGAKKIEEFEKELKFVQ